MSRGVSEPSIRNNSKLRQMPPSYIHPLRIVFETKPFHTGFHTTMCALCRLINMYGEHLVGRYVLCVYNTINANLFLLLCNCWDMLSLHTLNMCFVVSITRAHASLDCWIHHMMRCSIACVSFSFCLFVHCNHSQFGFEFMCLLWIY